MQGYRRKSRRDTGRREVWGYKTEVEERIERWERLALRYKVKKEEALESCRDRNENAFARPNRLCEKNAKNCDFVQGSWICQTEERGILAVGRRRKKMHRRARVAK